MCARLNLWFFLIISQTLVLIMSENVVRLNPESKKSLAETVDPDKISSNLNFLQLQMEILRLQEMLKNKQKLEESKATSINKAPKLTPTTTTKKPKTQSPKPNEEEDLKALQSEIETLQKKLISKISSKSENIKDQTSTEKALDNEHNSQFRLFDDDTESSLSNITLPRDLPNYEYPSYGLMEHKKHHMDEDSKNDDSEDKVEDHKHYKSLDFDLIGGKKNAFVEYIIELFKLIIDGDGKGIVGVILKLPTIILKGIIQTATLTLAKSGIKGVIIKVLVPLIAIVAINGILVFLVWWAWDDNDCGHHVEYHKGFENHHSVQNYGNIY